MKRKEVEAIYKRSRGQKVTFAIVFGILVLYCVILLYPFFWLFQSSLKTSLEYFISDALDFPKEAQWDNYIRVFDVLKVKDSNFLIMTFNSLWYTFGNTALGMFASSVVAYCLGKYTFGARKIMMLVLMFMIVYPSMGNGAVQYQQAVEMGLYDSPLLLLRAIGGYSGMGFWVLLSFFSTLPWDYANAAYIDGANDYQVFFKIMLPMAWGPFLSMAIINAISVWNNYNTPLLMLPSYPTIATGLYLYESDMTRAVDYPLYYTGIIISLIPVLIVFIAFQDVIMKNVTIGGIKG